VVALLSRADAVRLAFAIAVGLLILFTHRANLRRLRAGTEPRFERVRVLGRLFARGRHGSG
jgi:glycerol-3-phosphate acyltransferase PlsY